jgi:tetratricopeptide (TPR) repeat protein
MLEWRLFGTNASFYHLVSLLLHIGAVLFLFLFLNKATKRLWPSAFVAALFALHPLRVESVAWASEHKDVLSMFFGMATLYAYAQYVEKSRISKYIICLILFTLSIMSKPTLVTLPCVLLLLDYWPFERWPKPFTPVNVSAIEGKMAAPAKSRSQVIAHLLWEKAPFFLLSMLLGIMLIGQLRTDNYMIPLQRLSFSDRIMNTIVSYVAYLDKILRPADLACFYPYSFLQLWQVIGAAFVLLAISVAVVYLVKKTPFLAVGWFWYLGALFPVSGLLQAGAQAMADRYTYFPFIGIAIMAAWGILFLIQREDTRKKILFPAAIAALSIMAVFTWQQCGYWKNSIVLWNHALQVTQATKDNAVVHLGLGSALLVEGRIHEAIEHCNRAIRLKPDYADVYSDRGIAYTKLGQYQLAIEDYNKTIRLKPDYADVYNNRGSVYYKLGQYQMAIEDYNKTIRLKPDYADVYSNRGIAYTKLGQYQMAIEDYNNAIRLKPDYAVAYNSRGSVYYKLGQYQLAIEDYNKTIRLKPDYADVYSNRGIAYTELGQYQLAIEDFNNAIRLNPDNAAAYKNRGAIFIKFGQYQLAIEDFNNAIRLKPDYADAYNNRGTIYTKLGQYQLAIEDFNNAIRLNPDDADTYFNRGIVYFTQGNNKPGCFDAQKACALGNCKILENAKGKGLCH